MNLGNRIGSRNKLTHKQLPDLWKRDGVVLWGKDGFLVNQLDKLNTHMGKDEFWPNLRPYTKIHSRLLADLNVKYQIIKLLEENISQHSGDQEIFFK